MNSKAFLFDLNGTIINDMDFHTQAWFDIINHKFTAGLSWDEVKKHMYGKNEEVLMRVFGPDRFTVEEICALSEEKERCYQAAYLPHLKLISGFDDFLKNSFNQGIPMAIGSAAIMSNINFVLDNLHIRPYFKAIVSANDVEMSKPHPETFLKAAALLRTDPQNCIVFEDAPKGVEAAARAGMNTLVLTTMHQRHEFEGFSNIIGFADDYNNPFLHTLLQ